MAFESELGVQPPLGFFDPLGLLDDDATNNIFARLNFNAGRTAQLGRFPDIDKPTVVPIGISAISGDSAIPVKNPFTLFKIINFLGNLGNKDSDYGSADPSRNEHPIRKRDHIKKLFGAIGTLAKIGEMSVEE